MDRQELRARQAPLKQRYQDNPAAAATPLRAHGSFADPGITCTVDTWAGPVRAGHCRKPGNRRRKMAGHSGEYP